MGVKFKCLQSGNIFEFENPHDIKTMRTHPGYQEIQATVVEPVKKSVGRPAKVQETKDASLS